MNAQVSSGCNSTSDYGSPSEPSNQESLEPQECQYAVVMTDEAFYAYSSISSDRVFNHVDHDLELLGTTPEMGRIYDPVYEACKPPFECRVFYCEYLGIYYRVNDETKEVVVFAIVDQRVGPNNRFSSFEYGIETLEGE